MPYKDVGRISEYSFNFKFTLISEVKKQITGPIRAGFQVSNYVVYAYQFLWINFLDNPGNNEMHLTIILFDHTYTLQVLANSLTRASQSNGDRGQNNIKPHLKMHNVWFIFFSSNDGHHFR